MTGTIDPALQARLRAAIARDAAIERWRRAIGIPSVTGDEAAFGAFLAEEMRRLGCAGVGTAEAAPGRPIVWGTRKGMGGGPRLLVIGHLDTVHVRGWREHWQDDPRADPFGAAEVDGAIWGRGAGDLKAGIAAGLSAVETLDRAGVTLAGDVTFLFVADEESGEPGSGTSEGIKVAVPLIQRGTIPNADFVIYVEPTRLQVFTAQIGFFIADVELTGRSAYFGMPERGLDALRAGHAALAALWSHSAALEAEPAHDLVGRGFLLVTELAAGGYIAVPERCRFALIRKLKPGEDLGAARDALEEVIREAVAATPGGTEIGIEITYPAARDHAVGGLPFATDPGHPAIRLLQAAAGGALPGRGAIEGAPFWSEGSFTARQLGIPTVYFAPGDISNCHTFEERVPVAEYLAGVEAFAAFMAAYCGTG